MDKFDRIFQLHVILSQRRTPIPLEELMAKLECSKSTVLRTINTLKNHLNAPIDFDADAGGYKYGKPETGEAFELPGLWFTAHELQALALMQRLIKDAGGGFELRIPYRESHELVMDVMRVGAGVEVVAPSPLRREVVAELRRAAARL